VNSKGSFIRATEFNYPFLELGEDVGLTTQHATSARGPSSPMMSLCGVFKGWVFLILLQTHTGCSIPTATLSSNPAEH